MGGGYFPNSRPQNSLQQNPPKRAPEYSFSSLVPIRHWAKDPALRSWPVLLLIGLVCVPPIALVLLNNATEATIHAIAWIFAAYFALAWLLLLGVIVRPQHVHRSMLVTVAVIGVVTQAPIAIFLETELHSNTGNLLDVFTIGVPEELAKAIPIVAVAWIWRRQWHTQTPRDYLFLGAVSGLVFGAAEAVHYFTDVLGSLSGNVNGLDLQALTIQYIWRFLTDPIDHATWAGITGYFIGLAITGPTRKYSVGFIGIGIAAVLHGLNDWNPVNSHPAWVVVTLISVLLFLGYARAGAWLPEQEFASPGPIPAAPPGPGPAAPPGHLPPYGQPPAYGQAAYGQAAYGQAAYGQTAAYGQPPHQGPSRPGQLPPGPQDPWWQPAPGAPRPAAAGQPPQPARSAPRPAAPRPAAPRPAAPRPATSRPATSRPATQPAAVTQVVPKPPPKPWWEQ
jgi:RsiW-degrading membrane proteinase PrsW (M82 family)